MGRQTIPPDFAMYKGDELIAIGTVDELVEQTGLSRGTIYAYMAPSHPKRRKTDNIKRVIRLEE